jgi:cytochrome P450
MPDTPDDPFSLDNLLRPEVLADPYPFYQRLRAADPVHRDPDHGWVLTRHADVVAALRDPRMIAGRVEVSTEWLPEDLRQPLEPAMRAFASMMLFLDPPDHTRLRGLVNKAFTPRAVEAMRPRIQALVDELLEPLQRAGRADLIADFAFPLPVTVIAEMMGVPPRDREQFARWADDLGTLLDEGLQNLETAMRSLAGLTACMDYFREMIADHREHPREDLLQALIAAEERGVRLEEDELLGNCILILAAGHGTTTHLIGNGTLALLRHPDQLQRLRDDPFLIGSAVVELLRYDGPVQLTSRGAREACEIGGERILAGDNVVMCLGAANHDPAQFSDPDRLDLGRADNRHVAFGHGIHYCVGAPLAQVEGQIALNTLVRRFPGLRLETEAPDWEPSLTFRGLRSLPVALA